MNRRKEREREEDDRKTERGNEKKGFVSDLVMLKVP